MIIVGYTGKPSSARALTYAARLAARHKTGLRIRHAFDLPVMDLQLGSGVTPPSKDEATEWCRDVMAEAHAIAEAAGATEIHSEVDLGPVAAVLIQAATPQDLIVVGNHAHNEVASAFLGSVSRQVSAHAPCPVIVVSGSASIACSGTVLVGIDGSETSRKAARFGARWAATDKTPLRLVAAWQPQTMVGMTGGWALPVMQDAGGEVEQAAQEMVTQIAVELEQDHPDLQVSSTVVCGDPARVLLDQAKDADVLVVGSRGRGGFSGLLLGSISQRVVHDAPCPVAVVR